MIVRLQVGEVADRPPDARPGAQWIVDPFRERVLRSQHEPLSVKFVPFRMRSVVTPLGQIAGKICREIIRVFDNIRSSAISATRTGRALPSYDSQPVNRR